jgi:hypothetical protein
VSTGVETKPMSALNISGAGVCIAAVHGFGYSCPNWADTAGSHAATAITFRRRRLMTAIFVD